MKLSLIIITFLSFQLHANIPEMDENIGSSTTIDGDYNSMDSNNDYEDQEMPTAYEDLPYQDQEQNLSYEYDQYDQMELDNAEPALNDDEYAEQSNQLNSWDEN